VTCSRNLEEEASGEISGIFLDTSYECPKIEISNFSGIILVDTVVDPFEVTSKIKNIVLEEPWRIRYCHRFIPIRETSISTIEKIVNSVKNQIKIMNFTDTYRITIEKRGSELSSKELIGSIAKIIPNKVSLKSFDWIVAIQVIGGTTGISIVKEEDIISTLRLKRDLME
jgi:tRNA acetyltransferase TAN1